MFAKQCVIVQIIRRQRLFEPVDVIVCKHAGSLHRPFVILGPKGVAASRVNHQTALRSYGFPRCFHNLLVESFAFAAKESPSDLEGTKPVRANLTEMPSKNIGRSYEDGRVGKNPMAITTA